MSDYNSINKEESLKELSELVSLFSNNIEQYKKSQYDEANTRADFIDRFFKILGWDMYNTSGGSEKYRDVIREDKVKIEGTQKAPDYCFRFGGVRKFFVEAKKPSVNIKEAAEPAFQVRRYAYTAKLPLSILTNFEGFAIYDTRIKPHKDDKASTARINYFTFNEYEKQFEFIKSIFSKEAIYKGSFDKYIDENKNKKGTSEVDTEILALIEDWRKELAKNIAKNNKLNIFDLNTVVQKIIDRIIFLRIAEDRGIEDENLLLDISKTDNIYEKLNHIFVKANLKYNSGLFTPYEWIEKVKIENRVLKNIIVNLYYPDCPYEFSVLPVEILGSIYERFLGKTIRLKTVKGDTQTAIIEEKPEVKKAGGVYYTPQYIVDYIVQNTIGGKINNKTPDDISQIKICDPACGSGSFLVGAYKYLLDYHLDYYTQEKKVNASLKSQKIFDAGIENYKLTIGEKQRILTNNIFGVDIDNQAVEVTKLSLYLKLLESEGKEYKDWLFKYTDNALLPSLEENIKCGNSLIGTEFYVQGNLDLDNEERNKINCFDWEKEYKDIFNNGGFDIVIGNPPYSAKQSLFTKDYLPYYKTVEYKCDLYAFFLEKGINLIKDNGFLGFITPVSWMTNIYYSKLREYLITTKSLYLINLIDGLVFQDANIDTNIILLNKNNVSNKKVIWIRSIADKLNTEFVLRDYKQFSKDSGYSIGIETNKKWYTIKKKIEDCSIELGKISKISLGMKLRSNDEFIVKEKSSNNPDVIVFGKDISKYSKINPTHFFNFSKSVIVGGTKNPIIQKAKTKIFIQSIRNLSLKERIIATLDNNSYYFIGTVNSVILNDNTFSYKYILGILNSSLANNYFKKSFTTISLTASFLGVIPICIINTEEKKKIAINLENLVDKIIILKNNEANEKNQQTKTMISRQIDGVDTAINKIVYELYGLTDEEIKIIEG